MHLNDPHVSWDPVPQSNTHYVPWHQLSSQSHLGDTTTDTAGDMVGDGGGEGRGGKGWGGEGRGAEGRGGVERGVEWRRGVKSGEGMGGVRGGERRGGVRGGEGRSGTKGVLHSLKTKTQNKCVWVCVHTTMLHSIPPDHQDHTHLPLPLLMPRPLTSDTCEAPVE